MSDPTRAPTTAWTVHSAAEDGHYAWQDGRTLDDVPSMNARLRGEWCRAWQRAEIAKLPRRERTSV